METATAIYEFCTGPGANPLRAVAVVVGLVMWYAAIARVMWAAEVRHHRPPPPRGSGGMVVSPPPPPKKMDYPVYETDIMTDRHRRDPRD